MKRILLFAVVLSSLLFSIGSVQAQEARTPDVPVSIRMYPGMVTIYMAGGGRTGLKVTQGSSWNRYDVTSANTLTIEWETNATDVWQVEVYVNYTATVDQTVRITSYGVDMLGNPLGAETQAHVTASNVWIHLSIVTVAYPRPPTLREQMAWIFVENNPIVQTISANTASIDDLKGLVILMMAFVALDFFSRLLKPILGFFLRLVGVR